MAGLRPAPERVEASDSASYGVVVGQDPAPGAAADRGSFVTLYVAAPPVPQTKENASGEQDAAAPAPATIAPDPVATDGESAEPTPGPIAELVLESPLADDHPFEDPSVDERASTTSRPPRPRARFAVLVITLVTGGLVTLALASALDREQARRSTPREVHEAPRRSHLGRVRRAEERALRKTRVRRQPAAARALRLPARTDGAASRAKAPRPDARQRPLPTAPHVPGGVPAPPRAPAAPDEFF